MSKSKSNLDEKDNKPEETDNPKKKKSYGIHHNIKPETADWWNQSQTRRQNINMIGSIGVGAIVLGAIILKNNNDEDSETDPEDNDEEEREQDALQLQKSHGWDVGIDNSNLKFPGNIEEKDSKKSNDWTSFMIPQNLLKAYQPFNTNLAPYVVPTLIQSLSISSLSDKMKLFTSPSVNDAYSQGLGMREIIKKSKNPNNTLYIVDLNGPESVAFGAAMADVANLIVTFDNWPHPIGIVPSHHTLSALIFFAAEVKEKSGIRPKNAPALFILDRRRYIEKINPDKDFDNRYLAKLPTIEILKQLNIKNILYFVPDRNNLMEPDDLNYDFTSYKEAGYDIQIVPVNDFSKAVTYSQTSDTNKAHSNTIDNRTGGYQDYNPIY